MKALPVAVLLAAAAVYAAQPALTKEKAEALLEGVEKNAEVEHHPGLVLSRALGVPTSEKNPYQAVFFARRRVIGGVDHTLSRAKGVRGWLFHASDKNGARYLRVDDEFKIVATAVFKPGDSAPQPMGDQSAASFLMDEAALWAASPVPKKR